MDTAAPLGDTVVRVPLPPRFLVPQSTRRQVEQVEANGMRWSANPNIAYAESG